MTEWTAYFKNFLLERSTCGDTSPSSISELVGVVTNCHIFDLDSMGLRDSTFNVQFWPSWRGGRHQKYRTYFGRWDLDMNEGMLSVNSHSKFRRPPTFWADGIVTSNHIRNYLTVYPLQSPSQGHFKWSFHIFIIHSHIRMHRMNYCLVI